MLNITRKHSGKMKGMVSINTHVHENPFCMRRVNQNVICSQCYAKGIIDQYHTCDFKVWRENGQLLKSSLLKSVPKLNSLAVRFHSFGELFNVTHLRNFIKVAEANPLTRFALWSKRSNLIRKCKDEFPDNLVRVYSTPEINGEPVIPEGFNKVFTVYSAEYALANSVDINCGDKDCIDCLICYGFDTPSVVNEVLKKEQHLMRRG